MNTLSDNTDVKLQSSIIADKRIMSVVNEQCVSFSHEEMKNSDGSKVIIKDKVSKRTCVLMQLSASHQRPINKLYRRFKVDIEQI